jgi:hypothetical protein
MLGGHDPLGAVSTQRAPRVGDAITLANIRDALADSLDNSCRFDPHAGGQRCRIQTGAEVGVRKVQSHRLVTDADMSGPGVTDPHCLPPHDLRATGLVEANSFCHSVLLLDARRTSEKWVGVYCCRELIGSMRGRRPLPEPPDRDYRMRGGCSRKVLVKGSGLKSAPSGAE